MCRFGKLNLSREKMGGGTRGNLSVVMLKAKLKGFFL